MNLSNVLVIGSGAAGLRAAIAAIAAIAAHDTPDLAGRLLE